MKFASSLWAPFLLPLGALVVGSTGCSNRNEAAGDPCDTVGERRSCEHSSSCQASQECTSAGWTGCSCEPSEDEGSGGGGAGGASACSDFWVTTVIDILESSSEEAQQLVYRANTGEDFYFQLELYGGGELPAVTLGTFALGEAGDAGEANYASCSRCALLVFPETGRTFFAEQGALTLEAFSPGASSGKLTNARFVEVTIDEATGTSTPVADSECLALDSMSFDTSPPSAWECTPEQYVDEPCHCGCGALDPTCGTTTSACDVDTCQIGEVPDPADNTKCVAE